MLRSIKNINMAKNNIPIPMPIVHQATCLSLFRVNKNMPIIINIMAIKTNQKVIEVNMDIFKIFIIFIYLNI